MNKRLYSVIRNIFFLCVVIFLLSGCAKQKLWYKAGNNSVDFDLDNQECVRIAKEVGRQATITGEMLNPKVFNSSYNNCIFTIGGYDWGVRLSLLWLLGDKVLKKYCKCAVVIL